MCLMTKAVPERYSFSIAGFYDGDSRHPATLNARRVPVEQQISRGEQHKRDVARFFAGREKR